jgi:hypothetical protein
MFQSGKMLIRHFIFYLENQSNSKNLKHYLMLRIISKKITTILIINKAADWGL